MVGQLETIYDWIIGALGTYEPIEVNGEYFTDWAYIAGCVCICIAVYFVFRGLLAFIKGVCAR